MSDRQKEIDNALNRQAIRQSQCQHVMFQASDFNAEEKARRNVLYVEVVENGREICKYCGFEHNKEGTEL